VVQLGLVLPGESAFLSFSEAVAAGAKVKRSMYVDPDFGVRISVGDSWRRGLQAETYEYLIQSQGSVFRFAIQEVPPHACEGQHDDKDRNETCGFAGDFGFTPLLGERHVQLVGQEANGSAFALGQRGFAGSIRRGRQYTLAEAISYALSEPIEAHLGRPVPEETLTRREREVAELVAQGISNREIAAKLVVSPRTAEAHIEHILVKLDYTSRAQIAVWVAEHRASLPG